MPDDTNNRPAADAAALTEAVCSRLRTHRLESGLSIYRLAKMTGLSERAIDFVEKGERTPSIDTVARIALALRSTVSDMFREAEDSLRK